MMMEEKKKNYFVLNYIILVQMVEFRSAGEWMSLFNNTSATRVPPKGDRIYIH